eukprot:TRINITY_DN3226_c0_g1_i1.p1 TRINITY_DN3226_c0_g1~~TRINITY_DN3226_c0_g1_i1.p1  ORF type:complete len:452 (-),score=95.91 TRINITY_DN3226_c0_g1_i1:828-2183(-)
MLPDASAPNMVFVATSAALFAVSTALGSVEAAVYFALSVVVRAVGPLLGHTLERPLANFAGAGAKVCRVAVLLLPLFAAGACAVQGRGGTGFVLWQCLSWEALDPSLMHALMWIIRTRIRFTCAAYLNVRVRFRRLSVVVPALCAGLDLLTMDLLQHESSGRTILVALHSWTALQVLLTPLAHLFAGLTSLYRIISAAAFLSFLVVAFLCALLAFWSPIQHRRLPIFLLILAKCAANFVALHAYLYSPLLHITRTRYRTSPPLPRLTQACANADWPVIRKELQSLDPTTGLSKYVSEHRRVEWYEPLVQALNAGHGDVCIELLLHNHPFTPCASFKLFGSAMLPVPGHTPSSMRVPLVMRPARTQLVEWARRRSSFLHASSVVPSPACVHVIARAALPTLRCALLCLRNTPHTARLPNELDFLIVVYVARAWPLLVDAHLRVLCAGSLAKH